jgi:hypothetical protein
MKHSNPESGLTLIELLVGMGIALVAIAMASMAMLTQSQAMRALDLTRGANTSSREAMQQIEHNLRLLGWGVDPHFAIDLTTNCLNPTPPGPCRDQVSAPDQLAFVTRNPMYRFFNLNEGGCALANGCTYGKAWPITAMTAGSPNTVTISPQATNPASINLEMGRIVLAVCGGGQNATMLTLSQSYTVTNSGTFELKPNTTNSPPYNDWNSLQSCHRQAGAMLFLVDHYRYFIQTFGTTPWLMLDLGLDLNGNGTLPPTDPADLIPIAKDVEDMQVAYVIPPNPACATAPDNGPGATGDWIVGNNPGVVEEPIGTAATVPPTYQTAGNDPSRCNSLNAANVRGVRVSLRIRSDLPDRSRPPTWPGDSIPFAENRTGSASGGNYRRYTSETEITLRNLDSRSPFIY